MCTAPSLQPAKILPAVEADASTATAVASVTLDGLTETAAAAALAAEAMASDQDFFGAAERLADVTEGTEKQDMAPTPPANILGIHWVQLRPRDINIFFSFADTKHR